MLVCHVYVFHTILTHLPHLRSCPSSSLDLIKSVDAPAPINSASLHPEKDFFVAGGEDFKLYKFDYSTKEELGKKTLKSVSFSLAITKHFLFMRSPL